MKRMIGQRLRDARASWRGDTAWQGERQAVQDLSAEPYPETVFLFAGLSPEARKALEVIPQEAQAWRALAEMEAARARLWSGRGRVWD
ncbi:hypothetical protein, partial [Actinomadura sp. 7K507]|uniref:hypothetical protein n=1 Tax=Actinomadura sp. 7K507 TaxID=2530365 RepID=UPI0010534971